MVDILSSVKQFTPSFLKLDNSSLLTSHANTIKAIDANNEKAAELISATQATINSLKLNDKDKYLKDLMNEKINELVANNDTILGPGTAYNAVKMGVNDIFKDNQIQDRLENNVRFEEFNNKILNNNSLSADEKSYYLSNPKNQYSAEYIDNEHPEYGLKQWTPGLNPSPPINVEAIVQEAIKNVAVDEQKRSWYTFYDEKGNVITNPERYQGRMSAQLKTDVSTKEVRENDIAAEIRAIIARNPLMQNKFAEEYDFAQWYYDKYKDENIEQAKMYGYDGDGMTMEQFINNKFAHTAKVASFKNVYSDSTYHQTSGGGGTGGGGGQIKTNSVLNTLITSEATPVTFEYDFGAETNNRIYSAKNDLIQLLVDNTTLTDHLYYNKKLNILADAAGNTIIDFDSVDVNNAKKLINMMNSQNIDEIDKRNNIEQGLRYLDNLHRGIRDHNGLVENLDDETRENYDFLTEVDVPEFIFNESREIDRRLKKNKNTFFEFDVEGSRQYANKKFTVYDDFYDHLKQAAKNNNINLNDIVHITENKDGGYNFELLSGPDTDYLKFSLLFNEAKKNFDSYVTDYYTKRASADALTPGHYNFNIKTFKSTNLSKTNVSNLVTTANTLTDIKEKTNKALSNVSKKQITVSNVNLPGSDFTEQRLETLRQYVNLGDYKDLYNRNEEEIISKIKQSDFVNKHVYGLTSANGKTGPLTEYNTEQKVEMTKLLNDPKNVINISPSYIAGLGAGTNITVTLNRKNEVGQDYKDYRQYFIPQLIKSEEIQKFENAPSTRARKDAVLANERSGTNIVLKGLEDYTLTSNGDGTFKVYHPFSRYGKTIQQKDAEKLIELSNIYKEIQFGYVSGTMFIKNDNTLMDNNEKEQINNEVAAEFDNISKQIQSILGINYSGLGNMLFNNLFNLSY